MYNRKLKILAPKEFFLELNDLFRALGNQKSTLTMQSLDALARLMPWITDMVQTGTRSIANDCVTYIITEQDRLAICEAADILRNLAKGHGATDEEARNACMGLLCIIPVPVLQTSINNPNGAA